MLSRLLFCCAILCAHGAALGANNAADAARLGELRAALTQAPKARTNDFRSLRARHAHDPLWPWIELTRLRRQRGEISPDAIDALLQGRAGQPVVSALRSLALDEFAKRRDWARFRRFDTAAVSATDPSLRCHSLTARFAKGDDPAVIDDALREWDRGDSLPAACDPVIASLRRLGRIDTARVLLRIEAAASRGNAGLMRFLARSLGDSLRAQVEAEADFIDTPAAGAANWTHSPRGRAAVEAGLERLARRDAEAAEALLDRLQTPLGLELDRVGRLRQAIALWSAASYLPGSADRFARVPAQAFDERLHEWRVREALARRDRAAALTGLAAMPAELRARSRWRLLESRLRSAGGETTAARELLLGIAGEASFHGFIAADLLDRDYALCPLQAPTDRASQRALAARPGLGRALDLFELDRPGWAAQEWDAALADADWPLKASAVAMALQRGWYERAAQALGSAEGMRYYSQRFPLPHARTLRREARKHALGPAWVAGLIRAESSWMPAAHSHADARGLMQLLPGTGRDTARRLGLSFAGAASLHKPDLNIQLGTAYLRQMLDQHAGQPALATAAYNAGPAAVARWLSERPPQPPLLDDPLLWLETMPFHETRDYVARVMAFSLIYDWVLEGRAGSLLARLDGRVDSTGRGFSCAQTATP